MTKGEPINATEYTVQRAVVTGELIRVPRWAGYKKHRREQSRMATLKQLKDAGDVPPRSEKLDTKAKEQIAADGTVFTITHVEHHPDGENGPYWTVTADVDGIESTFDLQGHTARDPQMAAYMSLAAVEPIEGCILKKLTERMGNAFLVIDSEED